MQLLPLPPAQVATPPSRLPETVLLFVVFLVGCVVIDRLLARRTGRHGHQGLAAQRAVIPLDPDTLQALQLQANILRDLQLIPRRINLFDGTYSLMTRQNWTY